MNRPGVVICLGCAMALSSACGRADQPTQSNAATPNPIHSAIEAKPRIEVGTVEMKSGEHDLTLAGKVAYGEDRYSRISSPLQGRVVEVRAHLGDRVKAGDIVLVVDSPDIAQAYSEYVKEDSDLQYAIRSRELAKDLYENKAMPLKDLKMAENELVKARAEFRRAKERLLSLRVPPEELHKPLDQQKITSRFEMKSPLTGVVVERAVTPGQSVGGDPSQVLFTVADLDMLQVVADVYERDLAMVKEGQYAKVVVEAYPGVAFPATVAAIGDVVDPSSRTIKLRAWVNNPEHKLKPEMFARLQLRVGESTPLMTIPREAVVNVDGKDFVYVVESPNHYLKREVTVLPLSLDSVRVVDGLTSGQQIVVKGAVLIKGQEAKG
ncbi:putative Acriflavine resistance protein A [Nitrospira sp. KM1]|uniref:efflux RND transporter periplasmic adaptor subunit n=1 Tax=Nitrospira sp. KM1 TaxID=1936990 RepID=UPI0013A794B9|nr:efflux RND transporter periplasmic adaptor subunit [Nitrospira sp. KM1]BCA53273.1 putative Acriflavine resistance protein A [Nitrospira sp. KM1]